MRAREPKPTLYRVGVKLATCQEVESKKIPHEKFVEFVKNPPESLISGEDTLLVRLDGWEPALDDTIKFGLDLALRKKLRIGVVLRDSSSHQAQLDAAYAMKRGACMCLHSIGVAAPTAPHRPSPPSSLGLSGQMIMILQLAVNGMTDKQIGEVLGVKETSVKSCFNKALKRLHVRSRKEAIAKCIRKGLVR